MEAVPHHKRLRGLPPLGYSNGLKPLQVPPGNGSGLAGGGSTLGAPKPCLKFFSVCGCPYGEGCHFSHYVPGGISSFGTLGAGLGKLGSTSIATQHSEVRVNLGGYKARLCNQFGTLEGCRFGEKCHFAHGERELRRPNGVASGKQGDNVPLSSSLAVTSSDSMDTTAAGVVLPREPSPPGITASLASSSIKSSNSVVMATGVSDKDSSSFMGEKRAVWDHGKNPNFNYTELDGPFDGHKTFNQVVKDIVVHKDPLPPKPAEFNPHKYKTKMCEKFALGMCTFGERCHFAHGVTELRKRPFPA